MILAIDQGTTGTTCIVFDGDGRPIGIDTTQGETLHYRRGQAYAPTADDLAAFAGQYESDELRAVLDEASVESVTRIRKSLDLERVPGIVVDDDSQRIAPLDRPRRHEKCLRKQFQTGYHAGHEQPHRMAAGEHAGRG